MAKWIPTRPQIAAIRRAVLDDGAKVDEVALLVGVSRATLLRNKETGGWFGGAGRPPRTFNDEERVLARLLAAAGKSESFIAEALDCSREALRRHLGSELVQARGHRVARASAAIERALRDGDWRAGVRVLQADETGSWTDSARVAVEPAPTAEATSEVIENAITRMTCEERSALRVVTQAFERISAEDRAGGNPVASSLLQ